MGQLVGYLGRRICLGTARSGCRIDSSKAGGAWSLLLQDQPQQESTN